MLSEHSKHENTLSHMPVKSILEYIDVTVEIHTCGKWVNKKEMNIHIHIDIIVMSSS